MDYVAPTTGQMPVDTTGATLVRIGAQGTFGDGYGRRNDCRI